MLVGKLYVSLAEFILVLFLLVMTIKYCLLFGDIFLCMWSRILVAE